MKKFIFVLVFIAGATGFLLVSDSWADGFPWFRNEGECHQWWFNRGHGCKIHREHFEREYPQMDGRIAAAAADLKSKEQPMKDAIELHSRIDQKCIDLEEILIPRLESSLALIGEIKLRFSDEVLPLLSRMKAMISVLTFHRSLATAEVAAASIGSNDEIALSLTLDAWRHEGEGDLPARRNTFTREASEGKISYLSLFQELEFTTKSLERIQIGATKTLGLLTARFEADLESDRQLLVALKKESQEKLALRKSADQAYSSADQNYKNLIATKNSLPELMRIKGYCESESFSYWNGENKCHKYWK